MSNRNRGPSIDASYQVSVHLTNWFQRRRLFFINQPIRKKKCMWPPCLLTERDEISDLYRGPSIDAPYQVSVHLAKGFQRRILKCEKLADDGRRTPSDGKSSPCLWQGELIEIAENFDFISIFCCKRAINFLNSINTWVCLLFRVLHISKTYLGFTYASDLL